MGLLNVCRTFYPNIKKYAFFSAADWTSEIHHIVVHKENINRYTKTKETPCIISDHHDRG